MIRKHILITFALSATLANFGCGKPAGPDQKLNIPPDWEVEEHPAGDLHFSQWSLRKSDDTKLNLFSFVLEGASEETMKKFDGWRGYIAESMKDGQVLARTWRAGKYDLNRNFAFAEARDKTHGTSIILMMSPNRAIVCTFSNKSLTREPLTDLADKAAEDFAKAN